MKTIVTQLIAAQDSQAAIAVFKQHYTTRIRKINKWRSEKTIQNDFEHLQQHFAQKYIGHRSLADLKSAIVNSMAGSGKQWQAVRKGCDQAPA